MKIRMVTTALVALGLACACSVQDRWSSSMFSQSSG